MWEIVRCSLPSQELLHKVPSQVTNYVELKLAFLEIPFNLVGTTLNVCFLQGSFVPLNAVEVVMGVGEFTVDPQWTSQRKKNSILKANLPNKIIIIIIIPS